ncbi:MAG: hypothetical protein ACXABY_08970 [Candidatus Thorarchaeota archaeon]|jgi:hypothetical protein
MADNGWGIGWVIGALCLGGAVGYMLIPRYKRIEETAQLADLADRIFDLAEEEEHQFEALECKARIARYRKGIEDKNDEISDEEHAGFLAKTRKTLSFVTKKINPFSKNGIDKKKKVEEELTAPDAA